MGLTLAQKILLKHSGKKDLTDFVYAKVDFCFGNDITAPLAVKEFIKAGFRTVFNKNKIGFICDHFLPARDAKAANNVKFLKEFSKKYGIRHFYDINNCGIEHAFLLEAGLVRPGFLTVGADSHTCTYGALGAFTSGVGSTDLACAMYEGRVWLRVPETLKIVYTGKKNKWVSGKDLIIHTIGKTGVDGALYQAMEFSGPAVKTLTMEERLTMSNMAIEAGGKAGLFAPDQKTYEYYELVSGTKFARTAYHEGLYSDKTAVFSRVLEIDVSKIRPQVACPHLPSNARNAADLSKIKVDQVFIGSCTNGRISDLRSAADILKGRKVAGNVRAIVSPATHTVYSQAEQQGLLKIFFDAGCIIAPPTCGPCLGGHMGILGEGEVAIATTNRNFVGRMGHPKSFVYLSSPAVAAASAVMGRITDPNEIKE